MCGNSIQLFRVMRKQARRPCFSKIDHVSSWYIGWHHVSRDTFEKGMTVELRHICKLRQWPIHRKSRRSNNAIMFNLIDRYVERNEHKTRCHGSWATSAAFMHKIEFPNILFKWIRKQMSIKTVESSASRALMSRLSFIPKIRMSLNPVLKIIYAENWDWSHKNWCLATRGLKLLCKSTQSTNAPAQTCLSCTKK